jgi:hypothetical protein
VPGRAAKGKPPNGAPTHTPAHSQRPKNGHPPKSDPQSPKNGHAPKGVPGPQKPPAPARPPVNPKVYYVLQESQVPDEVYQLYQTKKALRPGEFGHVVADLSAAAQGDSACLAVHEELKRVIRAQAAKGLLDKGCGWAACYVDLQGATCKDDGCTGFHARAIGALPAGDGSLQDVAARICTFLEKTDQRDNPRLKYARWRELAAMGVDPVVVGVPVEYSDGIEVHYEYCAPDPLVKTVTIAFNRTPPIDLAVLQASLPQAEEVLST